MSVVERIVSFSSDGRVSAGTLLLPKPRLPGVLFVHGWAGNRQQYQVRARGVAALGGACLTFDLYGHGKTIAQQSLVTPHDNFRDVVAAYDFLKTIPAVDLSAMAVIGSSYGGYLAALLTAIRPVRWLVLRSPALYRDDWWDQPKDLFDKADLEEYRRGSLHHTENRALEACAEFTGDVLIVESEHDDIVPAQVIKNYRAAFGKAHSLTYRVLEGADHALSEDASQRHYTNLLVSWTAEMFQGARK